MLGYRYGQGARDLFDLQPDLGSSDSSYSFAQAIGIAPFRECSPKLIIPACQQKQSSLEAKMRVLCLQTVPTE